MSKKTAYGTLMAIILLVSLAIPAFADDGLTVTTGVDLYNRYVWRGLDIAKTPSIQPTLSFGLSGLELGVWGAYTLSNEASDSDEIDFWLSYTADLNNSASITLMATDYYYPNAGIDFFNFNDHDAVNDLLLPDPGAHIIEAGLSITGPESFPVTLAGYINVYNDAGHNTYFQVDYPLTVNGTDLNFFCGATGGSKENPYYYLADDFRMKNFGVTAGREIVVSESLSVPLAVSFIINPQDELSYLLVGISF